MKLLAGLLQHYVHTGVYVQPDARGPNKTFLHRQCTVTLHTI